MPAVETDNHETIEDDKRQYTPAQKTLCRDLYVSGKAYPIGISEQTGITVESIQRWCANGGWIEARTNRLKDRAAPLEAQLDRIQGMIEECDTPIDLARLSQAYEKLYGVYAWMRGIARPGVTQTSKPSSRGKSGFESPS